MKTSKAEDPEESLDYDTRVETTELVHNMQTARDHALVVAFFVGVVVGAFLGCLLCLRQ